MMNGSITAGEVQFRKVELTLHDKRVIDLYPSMASLSIYEDIFSHCLHAELILAETFDLVNEGPIVGGEMLDIEIQSGILADKEEDVIRYKGIIYNIGSKIPTSNQGSMYVIRLTSPEMFVSETKKISRYFHGSPAEIVKSLYRDDAYLGTQKAIAIEQPEQSIKFTSPYWTPFKIIEWLCRSSLRTGSKSPDFVNFETLTRGFQFISIGKVIAESDPVLHLYHSKLTKHDVDRKDMEQQYAIIESLYVDNVFNILNRAQNGVYSSRLMIANTLTKSVSIYTTDMAETYKNMETLNEHAPIPPGLAVTKNAFMVSVINQEYAFPGQKSLKFEDWVLQRVSRLNSLNTVFKVDVQIAGRFDVGAGRKVKLMLEKTKAAEDGQDNFDPYLSGEYLVTACCHTLTPDGIHKVAMQCVTESLSKAIDND